MNEIINRNKYESQLLDLMNNKDEYTYSDLQGMVSVIVRNIAMDESLLDFETCLERSKAPDLM